MIFDTQMQKGSIDVKGAAKLMDVSEQYIRRIIVKGKLPADIEQAVGGNGGKAYKIPLTGLPVEAQIRYWQGMSVEYAREDGFDLAGYRERYKEFGLKELLDKQEAAITVLALKRTMRGINDKLVEIAHRHGTSVRTLLRWTAAYEAKGLAGIARAARADTGKARSMCAEAKRFICEEYLNPVKRTQNVILDKLRDRAIDLGESGCAECPYNSESANHAALVSGGYGGIYPACESAGGGLIIPENRYAVNRVIAGITDEEKTYMRSGRKPWEAAHMVKGTRKKPDIANECWFGDHHEFDVFCLDENGRAVRPWLTAWYDIGTGVMAGWCISTNPNSETILIAFAHGAAIKNNNEIHGLPRICYMDNGKDYRGHRFEGGDVLEYDMGKLNDEMFAKQGALQLLHVRAEHAQPYHGWAKPVERWFRTLEERYCREIPGYCGGKPEDRQENFGRRLKAQIEKGELLTVDELADVFMNQILPAYNNKPHSGYGNQTPIERYRTLPRARDDQPDWAMLAILKQEKAIRTASTQGIRFSNVLYWDEALMHMAGQRVTVMYFKGDMRSITVMDKNGRYVCEAVPKEYMRMAGEDSERVARHVAMQKRQEKEVRGMIAARGVRLPGKRASGNMWYEAADTQARGNLTSLEAEKAARGRAEARAALEARESPDDGENETLLMFRAMGAAVLAK